MQVTLISLGGGTEKNITAESLELLKNADLIIGADRLLHNLPLGCTENRIASIKADEILHIIQNYYRNNCCVIFSGDTGFYSGAENLFKLLNQTGIDTKMISGVSSVQLMASRLGRTWQDWNLVSAHGVKRNAVNEVMQGKETFFLTGGNIPELCSQLVEAGLGGLRAVVGERLSYPKERIITGTVSELKKMEFDMLSVLLVEAAPKCPYYGVGLPDSVFIRGDVPMTKREVRANILSKLEVKARDIVWDIGAGTGSVSVELALSANKGWVYSVECNDKACELILQNKKKLCAWNLSVIKGKAPDILEKLPTPDAVFIGGSKGEMKSIIKTVFERNPKVRICIAAIALESVTEAIETIKNCEIEPCVTQISVSKTKAAGNLHMLTANNPVFLITGGCHE